MEDNNSSETAQWVSSASVTDLEALSIYVIIIETLEHLFFYCDVPQPLWGNGGFSLVSNATFDSILWSIILTKNIQSIHNLWCIWRSICSLVFRNQDFSIEAIRSTMEFENLLLRSNPSMPATAPSDAPLPCAPDVIFYATNGQSRHLIKDIFVDGAWNMNTISSSIGLHTRGTDRSNWIIGKPCYASSAQQAELLAVEHAICFALHHNIMHININTDCAHVVSLLQGKSSPAFQDDQSLLESRML